MLYEVITIQALVKLGPATLRGTSGPDGVQLYPNPSEGSLTISWNDPGSGQARIELINAMGSIVRMLYDGPVNPGQNSILVQHEDVAAGFSYNFV